MLTERHRAAGAWLFDFDGTLTDYQSADVVAVEILRRECFADIPSGEFRASSLTARTAFYRAWAGGDSYGSRCRYGGVQLRRRLLRVRRRCRYRAGMHPVYVGTSSRDDAVSAADVPCFPSLQSLYDQVVS